MNSCILFRKGVDNMLKWVGRFIFIMFVFVATVPVLRYAEYSRLESFYEENLKGNENDTDTYLVGISTMFGMDYYGNDPLFTFNGTDDQQFDLNVYHLGVTENKIPLNGLMIFVNNVSIRENGVLLENPILKISIKLSEANILAPDKTYKDRDEVFAVPSRTFAIPMLFIVDGEGYLKKGESYADIIRIELSYSNGEKNEAGEYIFNDSYLLLATNTPSSELAFNKVSDLSLTKDDYQLRNQFEGDKPTEEEITLFNLITAKSNITKYNWIIWRTVILYSIVVVTIAYFMFFHKKVMENRRNKSYKPRPKDGSVILHDPIFKDPIETDKDGK